MIFISWNQIDLKVKIKKKKKKKLGSFFIFETNRGYYSKDSEIGWSQIIWKFAILIKINNSIRYDVNVCCNNFEKQFVNLNKILKEMLCPF